MDYIALEEAHTSGFYRKQPVVLVRGEGAKVWDVEGREYIDCTSGHGVANIGHANPYVAEAIARQATRLVTCSEIFYNDVRAELLVTLSRITPPGLKRAFLCNSGTEAVEGALKIARLVTGRRNFVAAMRSFHGRTFGALSATWRKEYREPFEPLVPGFSFVPFNNLKAMEKAVNQETAGVILEVVQGEGGVIPGKGEYLRGVQELCRQNGALFILDEVQTGFGRTGKMFACEHHGLEPDLMCIAKGLGGGVPFGAVMIHEKLGEMPRRLHGSTFGGNPLACAAALAAIRYLQEHDLPKRAAELGEYFLNRLSQINSPLIREVRGLGLMVGIELKKEAAPYLEALVREGVLALFAGPTVIRFLPPLVITKEELDRVVEAVERVLS
ncbi:MAG: aspartate aminotransferase family protein [Anaerolineae bacterium]|nr:aspartate aminotransferase family protein [Anaerolineae bacterium]MDW8102477.1 aspartate aminotransferase family protein [Anaerolineae bacterium]